jgi:hypothetical protein
MRSRSRFSGLSLRPYRVCPDCGARYTADADSRRRQWPIAVLSLGALMLTVLAGSGDAGWILPALASHVALWGYIAYAVSKLRYVRYPE